MRTAANKTSKAQAQAQAPKVQMTPVEAADFIYNDVKSKLARLQVQLERDLRDLNANFLSRFTWAAKDIYIASFQYKLYTYLRQELLSADSYHYAHALDIVIEEMERYTSKSFNVRCSSTCMLSNETSTWEFMQRLDFIETLKDYKKYYLLTLQSN
jgi:hypothetical protein